MFGLVPTPQLRFSVVSPKTVAAILISLTLLVAGASLIFASRHANSFTANAATELQRADIASTHLPNLKGEQAIEQLRKQGLYSSLIDVRGRARVRRAQ